MSKIVAYLRASNDKQDTNHQKLELLEFARKRSLSIDEFVEITISSRQTKKQRRIDELMEKLAQADTLIVTELSRLGRSTAEVISLVNALVKENIRVIVTKQNLDISAHDMNSKIAVTLFSLFAELERDLISLRTKEALASKKETIQNRVMIPYFYANIHKVNKAFGCRSWRTFLKYINFAYGLKKLAP